jgi:hypothetical protein
MAMDTMLRESLRKARKKANVGSRKKALAVLEAVGITIVRTENAPGKRTPNLYVLSVPTVGEIRIEGYHGRAVEPSHMTFPALAAPRMPYEPTDEQKTTHEAERGRYVAATRYIVGQASDLIGLPHPIEDDGRPARARDYRTDLTIRTCPVCFRDIKASGHTHGLIADHGYQISERGWSGYGGSRIGSCQGVSEQPWEKNCEPAKKAIIWLEKENAQLFKHLMALTTGQVLELSVSTQKYNRATQRHETETRVVTSDDGWEWKKALKAEIFKTKRSLQQLWDGSYGSLPWYRMAVRTWKPVGDDVPAVGAPRTRPEAIDFRGKPEIKI